MKKLALASAVAAAMMSAGAYAQTASTGGIILLPSSNITTSCANTWSGGADGVVYDLTAGTLSGTVCMDPNTNGTPYVMVGVSIADSNGSALSMESGAIQIATNWSVTSGWTPYNVITVTAGSPIPCSVPTSGPALACTATLLGMPATLYVN